MGREDHHPTHCGDGDAPEDEDARARPAQIPLSAQGSVFFEAGGHVQGAEPSYDAAADIACDPEPGGRGWELHWKFLAASAIALDGRDIDFGRVALSQAGGWHRRGDFAQHERCFERQES